MNHRVIPINGESAPSFVTHLLRGGRKIRDEGTAYRGPVAFIGAGRVWAVANLHTVKMLNNKPGIGFLWCFDEAREVEGVDAPDYLAPAMFWNGDKHEPQMLASGAQRCLERALGIAPTLEVEALPVCSHVENEQLVMFK